MRLAETARQVDRSFEKKRGEERVGHAVFGPLASPSEKLTGTSNSRIVFPFLFPSISTFFVFLPTALDSHEHITKTRRKLRSLPKRQLIAYIVFGCKRSAIVTLLARSIESGNYVTISRGNRKQCQRAANMRIETNPYVIQLDCIVESRVIFHCPST